MGICAGEPARGFVLFSAVAEGTLGAPRFFLARALWESGQDRARALVEVERAERELVASDAGDKEILEDLRAWRKRHRSLPQARR